MSSVKNNLYEFGNFRLKPAERVLLRGGEVVQLTPKAFETLLVLVRNKGNVVGKEELLRAVWPDTFVEESTLAQNIFTLRKTLGNGSKHEFIETVPKRGYRFVPTVTEVLDEPPAFLAAVAEQPVEREGSGASSSARSLYIVALVAFIFVLLVVFLSFREPRTSTSQFEAMEISKLAVTSKAVDAVTSADGKYLFYIQNDDGSQSIWVKQTIAGSAARRVVENLEGRAFLMQGLGDHIYYLELPSDQQVASLKRVPILGGAIEEIATGIQSKISFSPDGTQIAYTRFDGSSLMLYARSLKDGKERLIRRGEAGSSLLLPAWSPDGRVLVCVSGDFENNAALGLVEVSVEDGNLKRLGEELWYDIGDLEWVPDGSGLVISGSKQRELSPVQIWHVDYPSGVARRVTNDINNYTRVTLTSDLKTLVTMQTDSVNSIWTAPTVSPGEAKQITVNATDYDGFYGLAWTPDGRIVYTSRASGDWDLWIMDADGGHRQQLTAGSGLNYGPAVSPDGRRIAFASDRGGGLFHIWVMDIDGKNPRQVTFGGGENFPHFSPDGKWLIYGDMAIGNKSRVWKIPVDGGVPVALTDRSASWPTISPDGKYVACTYLDPLTSRFKLAVAPFQGGAPLRAYDLYGDFMANLLWTPDGGGIAFLSSQGGTPNIWVQSLNGTAAPLTNYRGVGVRAYNWSKDGRTLALSRGVQTTSVVAIRNYRRQ